MCVTASTIGMRCTKTCYRIMSKKNANLYILTDNSLNYTLLCLDNQLIYLT